VSIVVTGRIHFSPMIVH